MVDARALLLDEVRAGKALQLATLGPDGAPVVCNLWFASSFEPDRLFFISRPSRAHCENLRRDPRVAGSVRARSSRSRSTPSRSDWVRRLPTERVPSASR